MHSVGYITFEIPEALSYGKILANYIGIYVNIVVHGSFSGMLCNYITVPSCYHPMLMNKFNQKLTYKYNHLFVSLKSHCYYYRLIHTGEANSIDTDQQKVHLSAWLCALYTQSK